MFHVASYLNLKELLGDNLNGSQYFKTTALGGKFELVPFVFNVVRFLGQMEAVTAFTLTLELHTKVESLFFKRVMVTS